MFPFSFSLKIKHPEIGQFRHLEKFERPESFPSKHPANIYLIKVTMETLEKRCEICS